jgi:hypothetical protein
MGNISGRHSKAVFPSRVYTVEEFKAAREAVARGHRHRLRVIGSKGFKEKVKAILNLIELAGYMDLLKTYIREVKEVQGLSQLRETEVSVWLSGILASDPVEGARFLVQKTLQMKAYLEGQCWYILGELPAVRGSIEFLRKLSGRLSAKDRLKERCEEAVRMWTEDRIT